MHVENSPLGRVVQVDPDDEGPQELSLLDERPARHHVAELARVAIQDFEAARRQFEAWEAEGGQVTVSKEP